MERPPPFRESGRASLIREKTCSYPLLSSPLLLGSGPEGADDLCFHTYGGFSPPSPPPPPSPSPPRRQILPYSAIFCQIWPNLAKFFKIMPISAKFCQILPDSANFCQFCQILLISAKFGHPPSFQEEEEEKIPHMCESIGHRPLRGRCPAPSLTLNHKLLQQGTGTADHLY